MDALTIITDDNDMTVDADVAVTAETILAANPGMAADDADYLAMEGTMERLGPREPIGHALMSTASSIEELAAMVPGLAPWKEALFARACALRYWAGDHDLLLAREAFGDDALSLFTCELRPIGRARSG